MIIKNVNNFTFVDEFKRDKSSRYIENQKNSILHGSIKFLLIFCAYLIICHVLGIFILFRMKTSILCAILTIEVIVVICMILIATERISCQIRGICLELEKRKFVYFLRTNHLTTAKFVSEQNKQFIVVYSGVKYQKCTINVINNQYQSQSPMMKQETMIIRIKNSSSNKFYSLDAWKEGGVYVQEENRKEKKSCI